MKSNPSNIMTRTWKSIFALIYKTIGLNKHYRLFLFKERQRPIMCMSHVIKLWVLQFVIMGNVSYLLTLNDNNANDP